MNTTRRKQLEDLYIHIDEEIDRISEKFAEVCRVYNRMSLEDEREVREIVIDTYFYFLEAADHRIIESEIAEELKDRGLI